MATSKMLNSEYYRDGEEINLCGTWIALSGQSAPIRAGFTIPGKKRIPSGATITLSNDFHVNWLRGRNVMLTPEYHTSYVVGDSVLVELKASNMGALDFFCTHIDSGTAIIHLQ